MNEQEFYEHIAKNYKAIEKYAKKYAKRLSKNPCAWSKEYSCWIPEFDEWNAFDEHTDLDFYVNSDDLDSSEELTESVKSELLVTAYLYTDNGIVTDVYVNICKFTGKP